MAPIRALKLKILPIADGFEGVSKGWQRKGRQEISGGGRGGEFGGGGGEVRQGVEHLGHEEGQSRHSLWLHPHGYHHRHELGAQAISLSAPQPRMRTLAIWVF